MNLSPDDPLPLGPRERAAEAEVGTPFDLALCQREPIHRLGGVQSYGALLAMDADDRVAVASQNCAEILGVAAEELLGAPVARVIGPDGLGAVKATAAAPTGDRGLLHLSVPPGADFDVTVYRADGLLVLEFEPRSAQDSFHFSQFYPKVRSALTRLQHGRTVAEVCSTAVAEIRQLTGYDRVVAYRFEGADGPGEVLAESLADGVEPWLGLWFPASDIPPQARRLYERNWIRVIHDVDDRTALLLSRPGADAEAPLDLSDSALRTVSSFHLEYLRNIGVASSMSVSVLHDGRLWGLIACHGLAPRHLDAEVRAACELFGVSLSLQLAALEEAETSLARQRARTALSRLVPALDTHTTDSIAASVDLLKELVPADGIVLQRDGHATVLHHDTDSCWEGLAALWPRLPELAPGEVWSSDSLTEHHPDLAAHANDLSGVLVLALPETGDLLAWTRGERSASRTWAADPGHPVRLGTHGERLTPRGSSAVYKALVRGRCVPWSSSDLAGAAELGRALTTLALRHSRRLAALNDELRRANNDLDTFAHIAAHELKEPLRGISNITTFIAEDAEGALDEVTARRLHTIQQLAQRTDELVNSLLHFAQLGHGQLRPQEVDLAQAVRTALEVAGLRLHEHDVQLTAPEPGTLVLADPQRLQEILINLLVNAAKYARSQHPRTVTVGTTTTPERTPAIYVQDNGIGIPEAHREDVLRLFRRLHEREAFGGGHGAGLAIVHRIVQRHGGELWIQTPAEGGTRVLFTLQPDSA
ncbi:ATP-binding protein [Allokutzneria sp. NRRL B-24872]|uniref:ATP-binding protein n=1 Tax=Allokutzneria sp. NRRL B-24872 TaxID=1137961 RepID=UPI000A3D5BCD|nr:ATP-binding protein [Allokutzneria sp. NRRL B-24872]